MPLVLADRVVEQTTTQGTNNFELIGTSAGYQAFSVVGNGSTVYYTAEGVNDDGTLTGQWEVGQGVYNAGVLSRDTILSSSTGSKVSFSAGQKNVFIDLPSEKAVVLDDTDKVSGYNISGGTINGTSIGATTASTGRFTSVTTPSVTATTTDLTLSAISTGNVNLATLGGTQFKAIEATGSVNIWNVRGGDGSTTSPRFTTEGTGTNIAGQFNTKGTGALQFFSGNTEQMRITNTASAVNYVQVTGAATGNKPTISAQGSDTNINLDINSKGNGNVTFNSGTSPIFRMAGSASTANYLQVIGSPTNQEPLLSAQGSDTNINIGLQSKGTGSIDLASGSTGVNVSNGTTVTAITTTTNGTNYTSLPSITISAPNIAGGVQATASVSSMFTGTATVASGGSGYTIGDTIDLVGGTVSSGGATGRYTVTGVSGGVITAVSRTAGNYSALPTNPVSVTGGTGTGATLNVIYLFQSATITNAGSGYTSQPTVTFSGGGGSGASAYATVGGGTVIRSLGNTGNQSIDFHTPASATNGVPAFRIRDISVGTSNTGFLMVQNNNGYAQLIAQGGTTNQANLNLASNGTGFVNINTNSTAEITQLRVTHTASAVNYVQVTGAATGSQPYITSQGSDTTISMNIASKGTSFVYLRNAGTTVQFSAGGTSTAVNYLNARGNAAGNGAALEAVGSDTNVSMQLVSKGTGAIDLAAGSSGVNISNGGTVTAITRTAAGSGYTSVPTVAITAPTTAGGVQATATAQVVVNSVVSITSGGTGYTVGDVLTISGGTAPVQTTQLTVSTVSAGVITAVTITRYGTYTTTPTNPASVTGGTGAGATFTLDYAVQTGTFTITNAGSGYIEQPTVSFSGGGGSGASAYATVGSGTIFRSLAGSSASQQSLSFYTPSGEAVRINDVGNTTDSYVAFKGGNSTSNGVYISALGTARNMYISSGAGQAISFFTGGEGSATQARIAHTASAVNYVQVTGSSTGNRPIISAQGSDANISWALQSKGTFGLTFLNSSNGIIGTVTHSGSSTPNYLQLAATTTTGAPALQAQGGDTNIDLSLTTKGTGAVRFNTGAGEVFRIAQGAAAGSNYWRAEGAAVTPFLITSGNNGIIATGGTGVLQFITNTAQEQFRVSHTASAVNYVQVTGAVTTGIPLILAQGSDTNVSVALASKAGGYVSFRTNTSVEQVRVYNTASAVNRIEMTGSATGSAPLIAVAGNDTNIDLALTPKGTGRVQFGTHTATADTAISGYIEILDAGGTVRRLAVIS